MATGPSLSLVMKVASPFRKTLNFPAGDNGFWPNTCVPKRRQMQNRKQTESPFLREQFLNVNMVTTILKG